MRATLTPVAFAACLAFASCAAADSFQETAKLTASDAASRDFFGTSVALEENRTLIGASGVGPDGANDEVGAAYVYENVGGNWVQQARLTASEGDGFDSFGHSVALSGDRAIIGAPGDEDPNGNGAGAAYVFERNPGGVWDQVGKLFADDGHDFDVFGQSVAIAEDWAIVGATQPPQPHPGAAYIFLRDSEGDWGQWIKLTSGENDGSQNFGQSVAITENLALVGAPLTDSSTGAAYLFARNPNNAWSPIGKLTASDGQSGDEFGYAVALEDGRAVIGTRASLATAAYVFEPNGGGVWTEVARLTPSAGTSLGKSVALEGDRLVIGEPALRTCAVFERNAAGQWNETVSFTREDSDGSDLFTSEFGTDVALSGERFLGGAPGDDDAADNAGAAYVFELGEQLAWTFNWPQPGSQWLLVDSTFVEVNGDCEWGPVIGNPAGVAVLFGSIECEDGVSRTGLALITRGSLQGVIFQAARPVIVRVTGTAPATSRTSADVRNPNDVPSPQRSPRKRR